MSLEKDFYRMQTIIGFANNEPQRMFLTTSCVRWYVNQAKDEIKPRIVARDLNYFNMTNPKFKFNITELVQNESMIDPTKRMKITRVKITKEQRDRTRAIYSGDNYNQDISYLMKLYAIVGNNNTQLSVPTIFDGIELFGSPLNTHNPDYCSPFEIEKKFGSLGSFFDFEPSEKHITYGTLMLCNPPFDETIMSKMADKIISLVKKYPSMGVLITIPVWDPETQKKLKLKNYGKPFVCLTKLKSSGLITGHEVLDKNGYKYYDYYNHKYSPVCYTHLITMGKTQPVEYYKQRWFDAVNAVII